MKHDYAFVTTCDTPLIKKEIIEILLNAVTQKTDVVVPCSGTYYQPLCAVYSKRCIPLIETMLRNGQVKVDRLFDEVNVKRIDYQKLEAVDLHLDSFFNVNTPEDMAEARDRFQRRVINGNKR